MEIKEMQKQTKKIINEYNKKHNLEHNKHTVFYHLVEEVGELARELLNEQNPWRFKEFNKEKFSEELVDILMRLLTLAGDYEVDLGKEFSKKINELKNRFELE